MLLFAALMQAAGTVVGQGQTAAWGVFGAMLLREDAGGYVLVAVVSFAAAAAITALCFRLRIRENQKKRRDGQADPTRTGGEKPMKKRRQRMSAGMPCGHVCENRESEAGRRRPGRHRQEHPALTPMPLLGAVRPAATQYTYTLHYDANGGSGAPPSQSMTSSEYQVSFLISDKIPTRDGYTFKGWADNPYGKPKYLRADGYTWYCSVVNGQTNSKTIYAIWEVHNHSWGEWTSNGNGTHTRTCNTDSSHTETGNCSGGKATGTEKAICETCHTAYGELFAAHQNGHHHPAHAAL